MEWRGIEWAVPVFEMVMLVFPCFAFVVFYRRVQRGVLKKSGALWRYAAWVVAPVIGYALFFFTLVGIEEVTRMSVLTEGLARSFLLLVGMGVAIWLISTLAFVITLLFVKNKLPG